MSKKAPAKSVLEVNKLISDTVQLVGADVHGSGIALVTKLGNIPQIYVNAVQLAQVLENLLRNSVDAILSVGDCAGNHRIVISSFVRNGNVVVEVQDTGCGISDAQDPFIPFESAKKQGMGVGLSISREIIEAHGGELRYTSDGKTGTTFFLNLPVSKAME